MEEVEEVDNTVVLFDGGKTIWKTRTNLSVAIVLHEKFDVVEIVAYDQNKGMEAPRLHVKYSMVGPKLNKDELNERISTEKELCIRQKKDTPESEIRRKIIEEFTGQYLLNRINIAGTMAERMNNFEIYLQPSYEDTTNDETGLIDYEVSKPPKEMEEFYIKRAPHRTFTFFRREIKKLEDDSEELKAETTAATTFVEVMQTHMEIEEALQEKEMLKLARSLERGRNRDAVSDGNGGDGGKPLFSGPRLPQESVNPSSLFRNTLVGNHYFGYISDIESKAAALDLDLKVYEYITPVPEATSRGGGGGGGGGKDAMSGSVERGKAMGLNSINESSSGGGGGGGGGLSNSQAQSQQQSQQTLLQQSEYPFGTGLDLDPAATQNIKETGVGGTTAGGGARKQSRGLNNPAGNGTGSGSGVGGYMAPIVRSTEAEHQAITAGIAEKPPKTSTAPSKPRVSLTKKAVAMAAANNQKQNEKLQQQQQQAVDDIASGPRRSSVRKTIVRANSSKPTVDGKQTATATTTAGAAGGGSRVTKSTSVDTTDSNTQKSVSIDSADADNNIDNNVSEGSEKGLIPEAAEGTRATSADAADVDTSEAPKATVKVDVLAEYKKTHFTAVQQQQPSEHSEGGEMESKDSTVTASDTTTVSVPIKLPARMLVDGGERDAHDSTQSTGDNGHELPTITGEGQLQLPVEESKGISSDKSNNNNNTNNTNNSTANSSSNSAKASSQFVDVEPPAHFAQSSPYKNQRQNNINNRDGGVAAAVGDTNVISVAINGGSSSNSSSNSNNGKDKTIAAVIVSGNDKRRPSNTRSDPQQQQQLRPVSPGQKLPHIASASATSTATTGSTAPAAVVTRPELHQSRHSPPTIATPVEKAVAVMAPAKVYVDFSQLTTARNEFAASTGRNSDLPPFSTHSNAHSSPYKSAVTLTGGPIVYLDTYNPADDKSTTNQGQNQPQVQPQVQSQPLPRRPMSTGRTVQKASPRKLSHTNAPAASIASIVAMGSRSNDTQDPTSAAIVAVTSNGTVDKVDLTVAPAGETSVVPATATITATAGNRPRSISTGSSYATATPPTAASATAPREILFSGGTKLQPRATPPKVVNKTEVAFTPVLF